MCDIVWALEEEQRSALQATVAADWLLKLRDLRWQVTGVKVSHHRFNPLAYQSSERPDTCGYD